MRESADVLSWIGVTVSGLTLNNLCYVDTDDIVLSAIMPTAFQQLIIKLTLLNVRDYGLEISRRKTSDSNIRGITPSPVTEKQ